MNTAELKLKIFRQVDLLDKKCLEELEGIITNFISGHKDDLEWEALPENEREGINYAIKDLDAGMGIAHDEVMNQYKKNPKQYPIIHHKK